MNYKDTKTNCRHLKKFTCKGTLRKVFIGVYRLEVQSVMLIFSTSFVNYFRLTFPPPPPFQKSKYIIYRHCVAGRGLGVLSPVEDHPKQNPRRGEGLIQMNTCREVPLQINYLRRRHFALLSVSLIFLRSQV
jgi:hypothetical protein